MFKKDNS